MLFHPTPMLKANIIVLSQYQNQASIQLGDFGLMHLMNAAEQYHGVVKDINRNQELTSSETQLQQIKTLLDKLGVPLQTSNINLIYDKKQITQELTQIDSEIQEIHQQANQLIIEEKALQDKQKSLTGFPMQKIPLNEIQNLSYLYIITGTLEQKQLISLKNHFADRCILLYQESPSNLNFLDIMILTTQKDHWELETLLQQLNFIEKKLDFTSNKTAEEEINDTTDHLEKIKNKLLQLQQKISFLAVKNGKLLNSIYTQLNNEKLIFQAEEHFGSTENLCCICGWIPEVKAKDLEKLIKQITNDSGVVQFIRPEEDPLVLSGQEQVPVKFSGGKFSKPFEFLIKVYGSPRYNEVEPTIFFALSFVLMFSIMFGDAGQGLFILLMGQLLAHAKSSKISEEIKGIGWLMTFCGTGSILMGLVVGSFFGFEPHHYPRLIYPQQDTMLLFGIAIGVGILCLSVSMLINIFNKIKNKRYFDAFLDKAGIAGIIFYWGSIGFGTYAIIHKEIRGWQILLILLPILFIVAKEPLQNIILRRKHLVHEGWGLFMMEALLESFEVVNGFFSNTLSFIRVGAFAISHAVMCSIIYIILDGMKENNVSSLLIKTLIIIFGNLLIILVEGMVVSIQSMRLQLYELFSKYFTGDGMEFNPFSLKK